MGQNNPVARDGRRSRMNQHSSDDEEDSPSNLFDAVNEALYQVRSARKALRTAERALTAVKSKAKADQPARLPRSSSDFFKPKENTNPARTNSGSDSSASDSIGESVRFESSCDEHEPILMSRASRAIPSGPISLHSNDSSTSLPDSLKPTMLSAHGFSAVPHRLSRPRSIDSGLSLRPTHNNASIVEKPLAAHTIIRSASSRARLSLLGKIPEEETTTESSPKEDEQAKEHSEVGALPRSRRHSDGGRGRHGTWPSSATFQFKDLILSELTNESAHNPASSTTGALTPADDLPDVLVEDQVDDVLDRSASQLLSDQSGPDSTMVLSELVGKDLAKDISDSRKTEPPAAAAFGAVPACPANGGLTDSNSSPRTAAAQPFGNLLAAFQSSYVPSSPYSSSSISDISSIAMDSDPALSAPHSPLLEEAGQQVRPRYDSRSSLAFSELGSIAMDSELIPPIRSGSNLGGIADEASQGKSIDQRAAEMRGSVASVGDGTIVVPEVAPLSIQRKSAVQEAPAQDDSKPERVDLEGRSSQQSDSSLAPRNCLHHRGPSSSELAEELQTPRPSLSGGSPGPSSTLSHDRIYVYWPDKMIKRREWSGDNTMFLHPRQAPTPPATTPVFEAFRETQPNVRSKQSLDLPRVIRPRTTSALNLLGRKNSTSSRHEDRGEKHPRFFRRVTKVGEKMRLSRSSATSDTGAPSEASGGRHERPQQAMQPLTQLPSSLPNDAQGDDANRSSGPVEHSLSARFSSDTEEPRAKERNSVLSESSLGSKTRSLTGRLLNWRSWRKDFEESASTSPNAGPYAGKDPDPVPVKTLHETFNKLDGANLAAYHQAGGQKDEKSATLLSPSGDVKGLPSPPTRTSSLDARRPVSLTTGAERRFSKSQGLEGENGDTNGSDRASRMSLDPFMFDRSRVSRLSSSSLGLSGSPRSSEWPSSATNGDEGGDSPLTGDQPKLGTRVNSVLSLDDLDDAGLHAVSLNKI